MINPLPWAALLLAVCLVAFTIVVGPRLEVLA